MYEEYDEIYDYDIDLANDDDIDMFVEETCEHVEDTY